MNTASLLNDIKKVYEMLEDEESRFVYINKLNYLLTGEIRYIENVVDHCFPGLPVYDKTKGLSYLFGRLPRDRQIVLYGAGQDAEVVLRHLDKIDNFGGFCDRDREKQRTGFCGYKVISPDELLKMEEVCVIICSRQYGGEINKYLLENGMDQKLIYDVRGYLTTCSGNTYFEDFLDYSDCEVFIDAGCKDLSTTVQLAGICPGLKKVYAFEPDPDNYRKCLVNREKEHDKLPETVLFQQGVWSGRTSLKFDAFASGGSRIAENGSSVIDVVSIDETIKDNDKVTFIKMDIEGSELEALKGAKTVIQRDKPKCAICIYHKPEDMVTIPLYIKELMPEYRLYVRHYSNSEFETVLYALP